MKLIHYLQTGIDMKRIMMKMCMLCSLLILILNISCMENAGPDMIKRWELTNETNHSIKILVYENLKEIKHIVLEEKGNTWKSEDYEISGYHGKFPPVFMVLEGDSLINVSSG